MNMLDEVDFTRLIGLRSPIDPPAWRLVVDESGLRFAVRSSLPLMAWVTTLVLVPGGFVVAGIALEESWLVWVGLAMALVTTTISVALRQRERRLGPYAEWDRASDRLLLRRLSVAFGRGELLGLQLLHAHQLDGQGNPGASISELHLIAKQGEDALVRYPLVAWNPQRPIRETAELVAEELQLPLREWRFGRQRRLPELGWPRGRGPYPLAAFSHDRMEPQDLLSDA